jgi:serine-type D-Ala-D-Ala carboxypeptidase
MRRAAAGVCAVLLVPVLVVAQAQRQPTARGSAAGGERRAAPAATSARTRDGLRTSRVEAALRGVLEKAMRDSAFPGGVAVVGTSRGVVAWASAGQLDRLDRTRPTMSTIWDLASLTKVIATTSLLMKLVDAGRVQLDEPVVRYLPQWRGANVSGITIRQLLTHSSGLQSWRPFYKEAADLADARAQLLLVSPEVPPGTRYLYSDLNFMLLGLVAEQLYGARLDSAFAREVAAPLGLRDTRFLPPDSVKVRTAPTEYDPWRQRQPRAEVHDENASRFGGVSGHAGLFSTSQDLVRVAQMYLNNGMSDGRAFVQPATIAEFTRVQDSLLSRRALGWETPSGTNSAGTKLSPHSVGHTGFTGTSLWVDRQRDFFVLLLTNRVNPTRENRKIGGVRMALADAVTLAFDAPPPSRLAAPSRPR